MQKLRKIKVAIVGLGNMGKYIPYYCYQMGFRNLTLYDVDPIKIDQAKSLFPLDPSLIVKKDLNNVQLDLVILALPEVATREFIKNNYHNLFGKKAKLFISITRLNYFDKIEYENYNNFLKKHQITLISGCGLEPGLTELLTLHSLHKNSLQDIDTIKIYCGGIPIYDGNPPFYYSPSFGNSLYVNNEPTYIKYAGKLNKIKRFSQIETTFINECGLFEAFDDGLIPFFANSKLLKNVANIEQKTLRWPGFARTIKVLKECGLFDKNVIKEYSISPFDFLHKILSRNQILRATKDIVIINIIFLNKQQIKLDNTSYIINYDDNLKITAMAKSTALTVAGFAALSIEELLFKDNNHGIRWLFECLNNKQIKKLLQICEIKNLDI